MGEMRDYDEEGWGKKERRHSFVGKTVISTGFFLTVVIYLISLMPISIISPAPPDVGDVVIEDINYYGLVYQVEGEGEAVEMNVIRTDGYAVIKNNGFLSVDLKGWRLNAGDPGEDFYFPSYTLRSGQSCRVYTSEFHPVYCGFSFGIGGDIWGSSDCGYLYDDKGVLVDEYCRYGTLNLRE